MRSFLRSLVETGRIRVSRDPAPRGCDDGLRMAILEAELLARQEFAFDPPALDIPAAAWAVTVLREACRLLVYRDLGPGEVTRAFEVPGPSAIGPSTVYSADLAFRYLPDLVSLARGIAREDPLVAALLALAREWPFSSVGIPDVGGVDVNSFLGHRSLRAQYVDRIIERRDLARAGDPAVREEIRAALGLHGGLAPEISAEVSDGGA